MPVVAVAAAVVSPVAARAGGDPSPSLAVSLAEVSEGNAIEPLTFLLAIEGADCDAGTFLVTSVDTEVPGSSSSTPVTPVSVTRDSSNPNQASLVLGSDTPPGVLLVAARCTEDEAVVDANGQVLWGAIAVVKVVRGSAPPDVAFTVRVACTQQRPISGGVDLQFTAAGGLKYAYYTFGGQFDPHNPPAPSARCPVSEPSTGGAIEVAITPDNPFVDAAPGFIEPGDVTLGPARPSWNPASGNPYAATATVTNTFPTPVVDTGPTFTG